MSSSLPLSGTFNIHSDLTNDTLCLGIAPGQNFVGDWACNHNNDQLWHWGNCNQVGYCKLTNASNLCLGIWQASQGRGARCTIRSNAW